MGLALACVVIILRDDWLIRSGENRLGRVLKHLAAMLISPHYLAKIIEVADIRQIFPDKAFFLGHAHSQSDFTKGAQLN